MWWQSNGARNPKVKDHLDRLLQIANAMDGRNRDVALAILSQARAPGANHWESLMQTLWTNRTSSIRDIFSGEEYEVLVKLFGDSLALKVKKIWDRALHYTYDTTVFRRSFRSVHDERIYLEKAIYKLICVLQLTAEGFSHEGYFETYSLDELYKTVIADFWALEIDEQNETVTNRLRDMIFGETQQGTRVREAVQALLMSHNHEAHEWVGRLLLAAKLQEGLRQTIAEVMDEGSREAFVYMYKLVLDHELSRFSSIIRAVDVWTGLGLSAQKLSVVNKCLTVGYQCLTDPAYVKVCLDSDDTLLIYMALWASSVNDVELVDDQLTPLINSEAKHKRLVAMYFLLQTRCNDLMHRLAIPLLDDESVEVRSWAFFNLFGNPEPWQTVNNLESFEAGGLFSVLFEKLQRLLELVPKNGLRFEPSVFPWSWASLSQDEVITKMMLCARQSPTENMVDYLFSACDKMDVHTRTRFVEQFVPSMSLEKKQTAVMSLLDDRSELVRRAIMKIALGIEFTTDDFREMEGMLRLKSGDLRKGIITLLLRQSAEDLLRTTERLAGDKNENKQLAALDLIERVEQDEQFTSIRKQCRRIAESVASTSQKAQVRATSITDQNVPRSTSENGFGLYDPTREIRFTMGTMEFRDIAQTLSLPSFEEVERLLRGLCDAVHQHRDYEYRAEVWEGHFEVRTIGGSEWFSPLVRHHHRKQQLEDYPLADVWRETVSELKATPAQILGALFLLDGANNYDWTSEQPWLEQLLQQLFPFKVTEKREKLLSSFRYGSQVNILLECLLRESDKVETYTVLSRVCQVIVLAVPADKMRERFGRANRNHAYHYRTETYYPFELKVLTFWFNSLMEFVHDDASFQTCFELAHTVYRQSEYNTRTCLELVDFERAFQLGLVDENELVAELVGRRASPHNLRQLTSTAYGRSAKDLDACPKLKELCPIVVDRVLDIEVKRGDLATEVSKLAGQIKRSYGTRHFVDVLVASGKDTYVRGYNFASVSSTKREMLSYILKHCYPGPGESVETLRACLCDLKVSDKQLVDAAMYAPQWLEIAQAYLVWPGLSMTGWYFHAHVSEQFSEDKKSIVARYSPIEPENFQEGAFDIAWFREAYDTIGPARFAIVYDSAKYIAGGALHRRAQLFADAVLGNIKVEQAVDAIRDKRNKDYVLCLALIPLEDGKTDVLSRYEVLQEFLRESKQFGAQRRESERKVVEIALDNLARNAGYTDSNRFSWSMEAQKMRSLAHYMKPVTIEDVQLRVAVDDLGVATLLVQKDGKTLKSVPTKLKKHETVVEMQGVLKSLKNQFARARSSLEKAMESEAEFGMAELRELREHPVIYPLLRNLVFKSGNEFGYFQDRGLVNGNGQKIPLCDDAVCVIAHPVHLYGAGVWADFQRDIFTRQMIQPFKQVFRELYRPNADELSTSNVSLRYSGHQIQPKKTVAMLRTRGWTVSYEEGLQRVYHKQNLIAHIYALADWFSPAEVEAPTLEEVHFTHRKTGELVPFSEVPPVIFSEVMRDVDLVVSVAHVGGVDPEASHSTIEMRSVLVSEMVRLLKLTNVELKGSHAFIQGQLGEYTVHLGSGVVHKMVSGAVHILPVHSQHRGRLFLPFLDDDPRTAEIISKITMLAEDRKIKDPNILEQLHG